MTVALSVLRVGAVESQEATLSAHTENQALGLSLAIGDETWLIRGSDLLAALGTALAEAGDA